MSEKHEIRDRRDRERFARRGRLIQVGNTTWRYRLGSGGATVIAYSEDGQRKLGHSWQINGFACPDDFSDAKWDRSRDSMVTPKRIADWLSGKK
jgi:hypothetical protein